MTTIMMQPTELDSPTQDALNLLNSMPTSNSNSDWNLFLQETSNAENQLTSQSQEKECVFSSYQYNSLTLGIPEPNWTNMGIPSYGYHNPAPPHFMVEQEIRKQNEILQPIHLENEQFLQDGLQEFQMSPRLNKDCRSYNCLQYGSYPQDFFPSYAPTATIHNEESSRHSLGQQLFSDVDARYDLPKLSDFSPDITNMINIENVDNELLKVVDSDDEESDIIVEESDTESEISISDVGPYLNVDQEDSELRSKLCCVVCNMSHKESPAANFVQLNSSFPLTFVTKTPVIVKLFEIIPFDMQSFLKFENSFICRRCLNLIDAAENLEFRLINIKQELCSFLSKTVLTTSTVDPLLSEITNPNKILSSCEFSSTPPVLPLAQPKENEVQVENNCQPTSSAEIIKYEIKNDKIPPKSESKTSNNKEIKITTNNSENITQQEEEKDKKKETENRGRYQCDRCGRTYLKKSKLMDHLAKHTGSYRFKCEHCDKGFMKEQNLQIHMRVHKNERKYQCQNCPASFTEEVEFAAHVCSEKRFMCELCPKIFTIMEKLEHHWQTIHKREKNICKVCSKEFKHPSDLVKHMRAHETEKKFPCHQCDRCFKSVSHLNNHIKVNHIKKYACSNCEKTFTSSKEQKEHKASAHGVSEKYQCNKCNKIFAEKRYLKAHDRTHLGTAKVNTCPICSKTFRYSLKNHMMSHAAVKQFHCEKCDIRFSLKSALDKHNHLKHSKKDKQSEAESCIS